MPYPFNFPRRNPSIWVGPPCFLGKPGHHPHRSPPGGPSRGPHFPFLKGEGAPTFLTACPPPPILAVPPFSPKAPGIVGGGVGDKNQISSAPRGPFLSPTPFPGGPGAPPPGHDPPPGTPPLFSPPRLSKTGTPGGPGPHPQPGGVLSFFPLFLKNYPPREKNPLGGGGPFLGRFSAGVPGRPNGGYRAG